MASVLLYHVVGDLTVGKPEVVEFFETETVEASIRALGESTEGGIPVWTKRSVNSEIDNLEMRQKRFVGILNSFDIVAFLAREECLADQEKAMKTPVSEVVVPDSSLLKEVDPDTRVIDALEMMKQGVKRLLVPKTTVWRGMSKKFSFRHHHIKSLKSAETSNNNSSSYLAPANRPSPSSTTMIPDKFHCLSREDLIRFLIGCLGALAPLPLSSISSLEAINPDYSSLETSCPAMDATRKLPRDPCAVAIVEPRSGGKPKIIGEISACKLLKCDFLAAGWGLANLSAGQFVKGIEDNGSPKILTSRPVSLVAANGGLTKSTKFSSRSIGRFNTTGSQKVGGGRSMYKGRSAPLTCKVTSTLAAVMAQMLSHRTSHVWVTEAENEDIFVGVVSYVDILAAVTRQPGFIHSSLSS